MKCPFSYEVIISFDDKFYSESGMSFADDLAEAATILQEYYGSNLIAVQHLELFEETSVIILPRDVVKKVEISDQTSFALPCDSRGNLL